MSRFRVEGLGFSKDMAYWGVGMLREFAKGWGFFGGFGFRVEGWKGVKPKSRRLRLDPA